MMILTWVNYSIYVRYHFITIFLHLESGNIFIIRSSVSGKAEEVQGYCMLLVLFTTNKP